MGSAPMCERPSPSSTRASRGAPLFLYASLTGEAWPRELGETEHQSAGLLRADAAEVRAGGRAAHGVDAARGAGGRRVVPAGAANKTTARPPSEDVRARAGGVLPRAPSACPAGSPCGRGGGRRPGPSPRRTGRRDVAEVIVGEMRTLVTEELRPTARWRLRAALLLPGGARAAPPGPTTEQGTCTCGWARWRTRACFSHDPAPLLGGHAVHVRRGWRATATCAAGRASSASRTCTRWFRRGVKPEHVANLNTGCRRG